MIQTISNKIMAQTSTNPKIQAAIDEATHFHARFQRDPNPANKKLFEDAKGVVSEVTYMEDLIEDLSKLTEAGRKLVFNLVESVFQAQKSGMITEQHSPDFDVIFEDFYYNRFGRRDPNVRMTANPHRPARLLDKAFTPGIGERGSGEIDYSKYGAHEGGFADAHPKYDDEHRNIEMPPGAYHHVGSHVDTAQPGRLHAFGVHDTWDAIKSGAKKLYGGVKKYGSKVGDYLEKHGPKISDTIGKLADKVTTTGATTAGLMAGAWGGMAAGAGHPIAGAALAVAGHALGTYGTRNVKFPKAPDIRGAVSKALGKVRAKAAEIHGAHIDRKIDHMLAHGGEEPAKPTVSPFPPSVSKKEAQANRNNLDAHIGGFGDVAVTTQHHFDNTLSGHGAALRAARDRVESPDGSVPRAGGGTSSKMINLSDPNVTVGHVIKAYHALHRKVHRLGKGTARDIKNLEVYRQHLARHGQGYRTGPKGAVHSIRSDVKSGYNPTDFTGSVSAQVERSQARDKAAK